MTAATPITTPKSVNTLRNLCAHKLEVAIATASEKFIDRFAVVLDKDRFAVATEETPCVDELESMCFVGRELDARRGWSMDKAMRECPHPTIRVAAQLNYIHSQYCGLVKPEVNSQNSAPFAQGCVAFSIFSII
jgi:hypothetical protein